MTTLAFLANFGILELLIIALFILWIWAVVDLIQRTDLSGQSKAIWMVALLLLSLGATVVYFITKWIKK